MHIAWPENPRNLSTAMDCSRYFVCVFFSDSLPFHSLGRVYGGQKRVAGYLNTCQINYDLLLKMSCLAHYSIKYSQLIWVNVMLWGLILEALFSFKPLKVNACWILIRVMYPKIKHGHKNSGHVLIGFSGNLQWSVMPQGMGRTFLIKGSGFD